MKERMKRRGRKERVQTHPIFLPQVIMPNARKLRQLARQSLISPGKKAAEIQGQKNNIVKNNIGEFYRCLFQALFGGKIVYYDGTDINGTYHPDIKVKRRGEIIHEEIKASWSEKGQPWMSERQITGYLWNLMHDECSEVITGIFNYKMPRKQRLYSNDSTNNRVLVGKLSKSTTRLLILPHNLLSFILSISKGGPGEYRLPYAQWISLLHENWENPAKGIEGILEHAQEKYPSGLLGVNKKDFCLDNLKADQYDSLANVYCGSHKVKDFVITEYKDSSYSDWKDYVKNNLDSFLYALGIGKAYERKVLAHEGIFGQSLGKSGDDVPF